MWQDCSCLELKCYECHSFYEHIRYRYTTSNLQLSVLSSVLYGGETWSLIITEPNWSNGPPLWSSGQCFLLLVQRSRFDCRRYQIFWEVVGLEWGPLSLVSTTEELLDIKSSFSGLENREYDRRDPTRWPRNTLYSQKLALTSPTIGGRSFGIVRSRTQATELTGAMTEIISLWHYWTSDCAWVSLADPCKLNTEIKSL
jgi:hypothetical protein